MAIAGGVSITFPQKRGYLYQEGGMVSPDGHCRSFDTDAAGTVFGSGAGAVLLKRLDAALADGDPIRAVIRGSAVNNDGARSSATRRRAAMVRRRLPPLPKPWRA
jgi:acyl transferase domain-containing protein